MVDKNSHYLMCRVGVYRFTRLVPNASQVLYEISLFNIYLKTCSENIALPRSKKLVTEPNVFL